MNVETHLPSKTVCLHNPLILTYSALVQIAVVQTPLTLVRNE
jgi:hypothetical protein